ncbi:MAG: HAD-IA family hydrolase [Actinobacteria bacterium]|nr:HAD-IA family hydrolase [Actinomycetota bacterium]
MDGRALQGVIFDVDGTLVDSERDGHRVAFNLAFRELGLPYEWGPELYGELLAITGGQQRLHAYLEQQGVPEEVREEQVPRLHHRKTELFQQLIAEGRVLARPGAERLLDELAEAGIPVAVATTGSRAWVDPLLERLFGADRFSVVITGDEAPVRKPDPSAYFMTLEELALEPSAVVAIEDSRNGLEAARAAGLHCAVVVNDYTRAQDFGGAAVVLDGFGAPEDPAALLLDPAGLEPPGRLDVETLRRIAG